MAPLTRLPPPRVQVFDGMRRLAVSGTFAPDGITPEEVWLKYAGFVPREGETLPSDVYHTILRKACSSNSQIDALCGQDALCGHVAEVDALCGHVAEVVSAV